MSAGLKARFDKAQEWRASGGEKTPQDFGFIDENDVKFHERLYNQQYSTYRRYLYREESKTGMFLETHFSGALLDTIEIPSTWPSGNYVIRARIGAVEGSNPADRFFEYGFNGEGGRSGEIELLGCGSVSGTVSDPEVIDIPLSVGKVGSRTFAIRQRQPNNLDAARIRFVQSLEHSGAGPKPDLWIDWLEVEGPFHVEWPPRGVSEIFFKGTEWWAQPDENAYAREIIGKFATSAFRIRPPSDEYVEKLYQLFAAEKAEGKKFNEAIREPLALVMASPGFLYLLEPLHGEEKRELNDLEMAVRLSYFLWSAPPDEALMNAAKAGKLSDPAKLAWHANRMINDARSDEFIASFAHQWLHMDRLDFFQFDDRKFDDSVKAASRQEVYETIRIILDEKRPLSDLLKSDHVVVNDLLASYYGIDGVTHAEFRKTPVLGDAPRGGLLGMAAILAMGSDGNRSSPVERGAWVMRTILNDPPPPAPPNVPQLSRLEGQQLSARELQMAHMEEAQCAQCHNKIDPIGFGLENFNAVGLWRESEEMQHVVKKKVKKTKEAAMDTIDASGSLPSGEEFTDFFSLRDAVAAKKSEFETGFAEHLIEYALGRPYGFSDERLREQLLNRADAKGGEMREFIIALIQSKAFRTKK